MRRYAGSTTLNKSSLLVVDALESMLTLAGVLLCIALVYLQISSGKPIRETMASTCKALRKSARTLLLIVALLLGADFLLPPEQIYASSNFQEPMLSGSVKVHYGLPCSGGEVDFCEMQGRSDITQQQLILVKRSRVFGRCLIEPVQEQPAPNKCS